MEDSLSFLEALSLCPATPSMSPHCAPPLQDHPEGTHSKLCSGAGGLSDGKSNAFAMSRRRQRWGQKCRASISVPPAGFNEAWPWTRCLGCMALSTGPWGLRHPQSSGAPLCPVPRAASAGPDPLHLAACLPSPGVPWLQVSSVLSQLDPHQALSPPPPDPPLSCLAPCFVLGRCPRRRRPRKGLPRVPSHCQQGATIPLPRVQLLEITFPQLQAFLPSPPPCRCFQAEAPPSCVMHLTLKPWPCESSTATNPPTFSFSPSQASRVRQRGTGRAEVERKH